MAGSLFRLGTPGVRAVKVSVCEVSMCAKCVCVCVCVCTSRAVSGGADTDMSDESAGAGTGEQVHYDRRLFHKGESVQGMAN